MWLVYINQPVKQVWNRENNVKVPAGNQSPFKFIDPLFLFEELAFGAVPVVARVVRLAGESAVIAGIYMPSQQRCTARNNIIKCFLLLAAEFARC
jgi:hypothetical protein